MPRSCPLSFTLMGFVPNPARPCNEKLTDTEPAANPVTVSEKALPEVVPSPFWMNAAWPATLAVPSLLPFVAAENAHPESLAAMPAPPTKVQLPPDGLYVNAP